MSLQLHNRIIACPKFFLLFKLIDKCTPYGEGGQLYLATFNYTRQAKAIRTINT